MKKLFTLGLLLGAAQMLVHHAAAAELGRFTFSGTLYFKNDPSNNLPASITATSGFTGTMSYEPRPDNAPGDPTYGYYTFGVGQARLRMSVTIEGHTFSNLPPTIGGDVLIVHNQLGGATYDSVTFETVNNVVDGAPLPGLDTMYMDFYLYDGTGAAFATDAIPAPLPPLSQFITRYWSLYGGLTGGGNLALQGDITNITTILPPALTITPAPDRVQLSWPLMGTNYLLEQSTTVTGAWSQVALPYVTNGTEISRTLAKSGSGFFFRLRSP